MQNSMKINILEPTPFDPHRPLPYSPLHGSLHLGDFLSRLGRVLQSRLQNGQTPVFNFKVRVIRGELLNADADRLFQRVVVDHNASLCIELNSESQQVEAYFLLETGEIEYNERIVGGVAPNEIRSLERLGESTDVNLDSKARNLVPISLGSLAVLTEAIPTLAEVSIVLGAAYTALVERRIRFGLRFEYGEKGRGTVVGDIRQTGWFLLDSLYHPPKWRGNDGKKDTD